MKQEFDDKLDRAVRRVEKAGVGDETVGHLPDLIKTMDRMGAKTPGTKRRYVDEYRQIFLHHEDLSPEGIREMSDEELRSLNEDIIENIQNSVYKVKSGDLAKRNKKHFWKAWRYVLESLRIPAEKNKDYIPAKSFSTNKAEKDVQADTKPSDLPTPADIRTLLNSLEADSQSPVQERNTAFVSLLWSTGPRIGEALNITMDQVSVQRKRPRIEIPGNKKSKDRTVIPGQCWKTIKDYIESHPKPNDSDAYLFYSVKNGTPYEKLSKVPLKRKLKSVKNDAGLDFKMYGEPFHIFRKGFTTFLIVNKIATWEEICTMQGKKPDATKPDYLKMSQTDANESYLEGLGVDVEDDDSRHRMRGEALKPLECPDCGRLNRCYRGSCQSCSTTLRPEDLAEMEKDERQKKIDRGVEILEDRLEKYGEL